MPSITNIFCIIASEGESKENAPSSPFPFNLLIFRDHIQSLCDANIFPRIIEMALGDKEAPEVRKGTPKPIYFTS